MDDNRGMLEADLEAEVCRLARMRQEILRKRAVCKDVGSCRRPLGRVAEVHGQRSAFLEQVAGWRQLAQQQSAQVPGEIPDWS